MVRKRYSVTLADPYVECLDCLVEEEEIYDSSQEVIRFALRRLFESHGFGAFISVSKSQRFTPKRPT